MLDGRTVEVVEVTSTPIRPVKNVLLTTKGLQDKQQLWDGRTVENKGKLIITEILSSVQKHDI